MVEGWGLFLGKSDSMDDLSIEAVWSEEEKGRRFKVDWGRGRARSANGGG